MIAVVTTVGAGAAHMPCTSAIVADVGRGGGADRCEEHFIEIFKGILIVVDKAVWGQVGVTFGCAAEEQSITATVGSIPCPLLKTRNLIRKE